MIVSSSISTWATTLTSISHTDRHGPYFVFVVCWQRMVSMRALLSYTREAELICVVVVFTSLYRWRLNLGIPWPCFSTCIGSNGSPSKVRDRRVNRPHRVSWHLSLSPFNKHYHHRRDSRSRLSGCPADIFWNTQAKKVQRNVAVAGRESSAPRYLYRRYFGEGNRLLFPLRIATGSMYKGLDGREGNPQGKKEKLGVCGIAFY